MNIQRKWGMNYEKFRELKNAIMESPEHNQVLRATILEALGLEDIPPNKRKVRSDGYNHEL